MPQILRGFESLQQLDLDQEKGLARHSVVTVGVFDGVHLGHQQLIFELLQFAAERQGVPTVITFENHPDQVLRGDRPAPISSVPHRMRLLRRAGVRRVVLLMFDDMLRNITAERFAKEVLHDALGCRGLLLGFDSAMGKDREGTPARFAELGNDLGFEVRTSKPLMLDGAPVSSTRIRAAVDAGDLDEAARLLGRRPTVLGEVVFGHQRGRSLGFPTANIHPEGQVLPPPGVYAVEVLCEGETWRGVANLGCRPTFEGADSPPLLEVHILDRQDLDLYGRTLEVAFTQHIREVRRFADGEELSEQIRADIAAARQGFAS